MFDPKNLRVGDVFYGVHERNTSFHRKKIHREIDGEDWFRYDQPLRTYELVTFKVLGVLRKELEGEWKFGDEYDLEAGFYLTSSNETHMHSYTCAISDLEEKQLFVDKSAALDYIKILEAQAKELDKT